MKQAQVCHSNEGNPWKIWRKRTCICICFSLLFPALSLPWRRGRSGPSATPYIAGTVRDESAEQEAITFVRLRLEAIRQWLSTQTAVVSHNSDPYSPLYGTGQTRPSKAKAGKKRAREHFIACQYCYCLSSIFLKHLHCDLKFTPLKFHECTLHSCDNIKTW